ncbi:MAG: FAD-dependent oxidoreductase [Hyphomicrobiales bacterium]
MTGSLNSSQTVVIAGGGQAGFSCASKLREFGFEGRIVMVAEESQVPYQRPPLSKTYMTGEMSLERILLRPASFYEEKSIELLNNTLIESIDADKQTVALSNGDALAFDKLVLATGARPRTLPAAIGGELNGVLTMRTLDDADRMAPELKEGRHLLVIGGGYIGLEAAAVARKLGLDVTVIEAAERILKRVASPQTSNYFRNLHTQNGVTVLEDTALDCLLEKDGHVAGAKLQNGDEIAADFAIVGIGVFPNQEIAEAAGLTVDNGIVVNEHGETNNANIYAIGDCASILHKGTRIRLESVGHAIDHAILVAKNICGQSETYLAKPWFWSDQYATKLQIAGLNLGYDDVVIRELNEGSQSVWYFSGDTLLAVDAMNAPRDYLVSKRMVEAGKSPSKAEVADPNTDLKALLK